MQHTEVPTKKILYGSIAGLITFQTLFSTSGIAAGVLLCTVQATEDRPVLIETAAQVVTAFNAATTNVVTLGTDAASANQLLAAGDITEATPGFYPTGAATGKMIVTANTNIYAKYTQTGTAATTGEVRWLIKLTPLDSPSTAQLTA